MVEGKKYFVLIIIGIIFGCLSAYSLYFFGEKKTIEIILLFILATFSIWIIFRKRSWLIPLVIITIPLEVTKLIFSINPSWLPETETTGYARISLLDFARIFMLVCIFLWIILTFHRNKLIIYKNKLITLLIFLILFHFLNFLYTPNPSWLAMETFRIIILFLFLIATIPLTFRSEDLLRVTRAFVYSGFALSLFGIFQYFTGSCFWEKGLLSASEGIRRISSTLHDPNDFARYLIIWLIFTFIYFIYNKNNNYRVFLSIAMFSEFLALFFTFSRGGWVTFLTTSIVFIFLIWRYYSSKIGLKIAFGFIVFFILFFLTSFLLFPNIKESTTIRLDPDVLLLKEDTIRGFLARVGLKMFFDHPIFGIGMNGFPNFLHGPYKFMVPDYFLMGERIYISLPQTFFIQVLAETGLVGVVIFLSIIFLFFRNILFILKKTKNYFYKLNAIALGSSFFAILIASQAESSFYTEPFLWVIISLVISLNLIVKKELINTQPAELLDARVITSNV